MPDTLQGILVIVLALLPGALYTWAFEQQAGPWSIGLPDRVLRFIGSSAVVHAFLAPATYELWRRFIEPGRVAHGEALPPAVWLVPIVYVVLPTLAGRRVGIATRRRKHWSTLITGATPAPTAWDHIFGSEGLRLPDPRSVHEHHSPHGNGAGGTQNTADPSRPVTQMRGWSARGPRSTRPRGT